MDVPLHDAWRGRVPPFDGETLVAASLALPVLREALRICERGLYESYRREALFTQLDFHGRDGYVQPVEEVSWMELDYALRDETTIVAWTGEESGVHRLFVPEERQALLRWNVSFDRLPIVGDLDLSAPREVLLPVFYQLERLLGSEAIKLLPSALYFDSQWRKAEIATAQTVIDPSA